MGFGYGGISAVVGRGYAVGSAVEHLHQAVAFILQLVGFNIGAIGGSGVVFVAGFEKELFGTDGLADVLRAEGVVFGAQLKEFAGHFNGFGVGGIFPEGVAAIGDFLEGEVEIGAGNGRAFFPEESELIVGLPGHG